MRWQPMANALASVWSGLRRPVERLRLLVSALPSSARSLSQAIRHDPIARRRLAIVLIAFVVASYAITVLGYVLFTPEVGIRIGFTPVVSRFYPDFLYPETQALLREGDQVLALGDRET